MSGGRALTSQATKEPLLNAPSDYTAQHEERLAQIHERLVEARRELDALIGDAYLRPRASIVPVHFLDLASAVEKLRWAEKEWRELDQELAATRGRQEQFPAEELAKLREPAESSAR
ncbi:MAG: hypothetical protein ACR2KQ_00445 [Actinomycetota bacterium]